MFKKLIEILQGASPQDCIYRGHRSPHSGASARLLSGTFLTPVLVGNPEAIQAAAEEAGFNIRGAIILTPTTMKRWTPWWPAWWSCARAR